VGLRVYGHRYTTLDRKRASTDSQLLIPIGPLDRQKFLTTVQRLGARGGTPLAYSIEQAAKELRRVKRARAIFVTDGVESFGGDPVAAARTLATAVPELEVAVVGFAIDVRSDQANLENMAKAAGGTYFNAADARSLVTALEAAINPRIPYTVLDGGKREVARGRFGDRHTLLEGSYSVTVATAEGPRALDVTIRPKGETVLPVPEGIDAAAAAALGDPAPPPKEHCANCGARLLPAANFCTKCGTKVKK
jgi:Ca-activated chloride channel family protein